MPPACAPAAAPSAPAAGNLLPQALANSPFDKVNLSTWRSMSTRVRGPSDSVARVKAANGPEYTIIDLMDSQGVQSIGQGSDVHACNRRRGIPSGRKQHQSQILLCTPLSDCFAAAQLLAVSATPKQTASLTPLLARATRVHASLPC